jgi:threonylcarbamoyladenosine tRNA methylthiotransferase MtaB
VTEAILDAAPNARVRLGSLEPTVITEEFCSRLSKSGRLCPHFHLSLQSGCDGVLSRMNRKYDTARFYSAVELLRKYFPGCGLTADLITGFPEETEQEHEATLAFIEKCGFSSMHIFPYSIRPGTKAADMPQLPKQIKSRRAHEAQQIANAMKQKFLLSCIGKTLPVLFESDEDGTSRGHADNYCEVAVKGRNLHGLVRNVKITEIRDEMLVGEVI